MSIPNVNASINKWSTYEANVQSYRANMIASQTFLLAVAAILYEQSFLFLCICVGVALFQLWYIWFRIIRVRTIIVDYHKFELFSKFNDRGEYAENSTNPLLEDTYLKNKAIRKQVNAIYADIKRSPKLIHNMRTTRLKIDLIMPLSFTFMWVCYLIFGLIA